MSMTMNSYHKYINSPAEIFKMRMQLKAEVNDLRKTYQAVVAQKPSCRTPNKKHFANLLYTETTLIPDQKNHRPLRRSITPSQKKHNNDRSLHSGKKQFQNTKNGSTISEVMKFDQKRKKSFSPAFFDMIPGRITQTPNQRRKNPFNICQRDKSPETPLKTSKRIMPQHHQYDKGFLLG